jgi:hypothetical protein
MPRHLYKTALELKKDVAQAVQTARDSGSPNTRVRVNDGDGLRVDCTASGNTSWQLVYRMSGQNAPKTFTIGPYPALSMSVAREHADKLRLKIANGVDPMQEKKAARQQEQAAEVLIQGEKVEKILGEYLDNCLAEGGYANVSVATMRACFERDVYPAIGQKVAVTVTPEDIEEILRRVEARRALETLRRIASWIKAGFAYGRIKPNPVKAVDLDDLHKRPNRADDGHPGATDPETPA